MRIELIAPAIPGASQATKKALVPPLGIAMVAALTPPDIEVSITDENVTPIDFQKQLDLVGITTLTVTAPRAYQIADTFRVRGVSVILGGIHSSILPQEAARHADSLIIGEAEGVWSRVIEDFKADRLHKEYRAAERPSLVGLPVPRRDLFAKNAYYVRNTVSATRGCPFACSFCSVTLYFGRTYRCRPAEEVVNEVETLKDRGIVFFVDDNIVGNPRFAKELFGRLIPCRLRWVGQASVTIAKDDELLRLAAASGCIGLLIGFETLSQANLEKMNKKLNVAAEYDSIIRKIHSHGIGIHGCFILGLDGDDESVFKDTVRFARKMRLESAGFPYPTPLPGTALYESLEKDGRLLTDEWARYNSEIVFEPKLMSRDSLERGHAWASREFFSLPSIWARIGLRRRNLVLLWAINLIWRRHFRKNSGQVAPL